MARERQNLILDDMAADLGLSKSTVSRAISGKGRVSDETRRRVLEYADHHGFSPNSIASSLARSKTNNIGVVIPTEAFNNEIPFFHECLMGVCYVASQRHYDVLITPIGEGDISVLKRIVSQRKVDGILLTRSHVVDASAEYLKSTQIPFVTVGSLNDPDITQVDLDTSTACHTLTGRVLERSGVRLALILGPLEYIVNRDRFEGFSSALADAGRSLAEVTIFSGITGGKNVRDACRSALAAGANVILCGDDFICVKTVEQLLEDNRSDIRVSSFYNNDNLRNLPFVDLVVSVDVRTYGTTSGKLLIDLIENKPTSKKTYIPYSILQYKH